MTYAIQRVTTLLIITCLIAVAMLAFSATQVHAQSNVGQSWRTPTDAQKPKVEKNGDLACTLKYGKPDQQVLQAGCKEGVRVFISNTKSITPQKACEKVTQELVEGGTESHVVTTPGCPDGFLIAAQKLAELTKVAAQKPDAVGKSGANLGKSKKEACKKFKNASNKQKCEQAYDKQKENNKKAFEDGKKMKDINDPALKCVENPNECNLVKKYINPIIYVLTAFVGIAVTIGIISGGIRYASAGDDPSKMGAAKKQIGTAIVALFALLVLYAAIRWITPNL